MIKNKINIFWFRRDLRFYDNAALFHALNHDLLVVPIFIFDTNILDELPDKSDRRVCFIHHFLKKLNEELQELKSRIEVFYGNPNKVFQLLMKKYNIGTVFTNHDYEPYAMIRDDQVKKMLEKNCIPFLTFKDHVIFEKDEIVKNDGTPYTIFTPYSRKWKYMLADSYLTLFPSENHKERFLKQVWVPIVSLAEIGFNDCNERMPVTNIEDQVYKNYATMRDFPGINGTSRLGVHLRFGTISIRKLAAHAKDLSDIFLNELIWRDFYHSILWHYPRVGKGLSFKPAYDHIQWRNDKNDFEKWCEGKTGYPLVDAGMRELNRTGFMHNRIRMVTASFLCKHLLIDWRLGEAYFASKLSDFDLAANNGGWQWASGSGCDSAPYFRIFNPYLQAKKFDPKSEYIKKWVPEYQDDNYPPPMIQHEFARKRCLETYSASLNGQMYSVL